MNELMNELKTEYQENITKLEEVMEFVDDNLDYRPARKYVLKELKFIKHYLQELSEQLFL